MHAVFSHFKCAYFQSKVVTNEMDGSFLITVPLKRFVRFGLHIMPLEYTGTLTNVSSMCKLKATHGPVR